MVCEFELIKSRIVSHKRLQAAKSVRLLGCRSLLAPDGKPAGAAATALAYRTTVYFILAVNRSSPR
jgi:hypothetical protein